MSISSLVELVHASESGNWKKRNEAAYQSLFGSSGRFHKNAAASMAVRAPEMSAESGVPFAAYIHQSNPPSGGYSGLSFAIFPVPNEPCLITLVVGTQGLTPDEGILGRPGHARKTQAICSWLNREYGKGKLLAWAKQDPTRTDLSTPGNVIQSLPAYKGVFDRYGKEIYAFYVPNEDKTGTAAALQAFLDLLLEERGYQPNSGSQAQATAIRSAWFEYLMPAVEASDMRDLLESRRFVILQGPPGTGKTRLAQALLRSHYHGKGKGIQFHANTTYENFIGGLAPAESGGELGLRFQPAPGFLMIAAAEASRDPSPYLLHIDEINRADLSKVLGEAIYLLESTDPDRQIELPFDFGAPFSRTFFLPPNLHILGTMNSADRSIASIDLAVRRRFAFVSLWPRMTVVQEHSCSLMQTQFGDLLSIFIEHASSDSYSLVPGHSYFLESDEKRAVRSLNVNLIPLLEEYLAQGYVSGFAEQIRGYLQQLRSL